MYLLCLFSLFSCLFFKSQAHTLEGMPNSSPRFLLRPQPETVLSGGIVVFTCGANGNPLPEVFFSVDGTPVLYDRQRYTVRTVMTELHHWVSLQIEDVRYRSDNGLVVSCIADNGIGDSIRDEAELTVISSRKESFIPAGFPEVAEISSSKVQYHGVGTPVTLQCNSTGETPERYKWFRNLQIITMNTESGELEIINATRSNAGEYMCSVRNSYGSAYSEKIRIIIGESAMITTPPKDYRVKEGGRVSFYCHASGDPGPKVTWKVNDDVISDDMGIGYDVIQKENGSVLIINHVVFSRDHKLELTCEATNEIGHVTAESSLLEVYKTFEVPDCYPRILTQPSLTKVTQDHNVTLGCTVTGSPAPTVYWLHDGVPVDTSELWYTVSDSGSLKITFVHVDDEGFYECVAENSVGVAYSDAAYLYVEDLPRAPEIVSLPESPMTISAGSDLSLTCEAVGTPIPYIEWSVDGGTVLTDLLEVPRGRGTVTVVDIWQGGVYSCRAYSATGEVIRNIHVSVTSK